MIRNNNAHAPALMMQGRRLVISDENAQRDQPIRSAAKEQRENKDEGEPSPKKDSHEAK